MKSENKIEIIENIPERSKFSFFWDCISKLSQIMIQFLPIIIMGILGYYAGGSYNRIDYCKNAMIIYIVDDLANRNNGKSVGMINNSWSDIFLIVGVLLYIMMEAGILKNDELSFYLVSIGIVILHFGKNMVREIAQEIGRPL